MTLSRMSVTINGLAYETGSPSLIYYL